MEELFMEVAKLVELYQSKFPASSLTEEQLKKEMAWLLENNFTAESIFFSINYSSKYYSSECEESLKNCLDNNRQEMLKYYHIAKAKQTVKFAKESEESYDSKNKYERADSPSWFRKSFDKHLFE
jgi:hypothetical protein